jgi:hypothetical protein
MNFIKVSVEKNGRLNFPLFGKFVVSNEMTLKRKKGRKAILFSLLPLYMTNSAYTAIKTCSASPKP